MEVTAIRTILDQRKGQKFQIEEGIKEHRQNEILNTKKLILHEKAKEIVRSVGIKTQQQLQFHISDITSLAMEAVFENPYKLKVEFIQRRNKTECDLSFTRDGNEIDPMEESGGGAVDLASFALRIASWSLQTPHSRNTIILDEPMRFLSEDLQEKASAMLKEISKKLKIQFIIVTHEPTLAAYADKVFEVSIKKGVSKVKGFSNDRN